MILHKDPHVISSEKQNIYIARSSVIINFRETKIYIGWHTNKRQININLITAVITNTKQTVSAFILHGISPSDFHHMIEIYRMTLIDRLMDSRGCFGCTYFPGCFPCGLCQLQVYGVQRKVAACTFFDHVPRAHCCFQ